MFNNRQPMLEATKQHAGADGGLQEGGGTGARGCNMPAPLHRNPTCRASVRQRRNQTFLYIFTSPGRET